MCPKYFTSLRAAQPGEAMAHKLGYQKAIGSSLHLVWCIRSDIALSVGVLAAYTSAPSEAHHKALLNVVSYVGSIAGWGLTFEGSDKPVGFECDANFPTCQET
jgi:hypothetical protein